MSKSKLDMNGPGRADCFGWAAVSMAISRTRVDMKRRYYDLYAPKQRPEVVTIEPKSWQHIPIAVESLLLVGVT